MLRLCRFAACCWAVALLLVAANLSAAEPSLGPGAQLAELVAGPTTYRQVVVRSVNARSLIITHAGGLASIRLRDLAPEWQERFRYSPAAEAAAEQAAVAAPAPAPRTPAAPKAPAPRKVATRFDALLLQFGQPAEVQAEVDLRKKYLELELGVKNQGRRPSCAIFAVVSALEFQNAELAGRTEKFSEEYLIWAVRRSVQRPARPATGEAAAEDTDEGFALGEVVEALRAYGIPLQSSMPNTFGRSLATIEDPPQAVIKEASSHQRIFVHHVPGRDAATRLNNVIHALNAGLPVPVGMAWPNYRTLRSGYLSSQKPNPGSGHAVTLVGYKSASGRIEDAVFLFKNSWGIDWGQGGYGMVTYGYLSSYLNDAVVLEVQPSPRTP